MSQNKKNNQTQTEPLPQQNNVVGPYDQADFRTMQMLKASLKMMKAANDNEWDYTDCIQMETEILKDYFQKTA